LIANSTGVTYLSEYDGEIFKSLGARKLIRTYVPAPNLKSNRLSFLPGPKVLLDNKYRWFTFVSGDWSPHVSGALELIKSMRSGNENNIGLVVAGAIANGLERNNLESKFPNLSSRDDILILGQISTNVLLKLVEESTGFVLPVDFGGGMGIKTVEAIQSLKPVFGTKSAFRGLEEFNLGNQVTISEDSSGLWPLLQSWSPQEYEVDRNLRVFNNRALVSPSVEYVLSLVRIH
jgi:hypothetical protein